ncbi:MAG: nitrate- and nitrite sensing domain-containing protein [Streptosporangiaceae bacterium]
MVTLIALWAFSAQVTLSAAINKFQISTTYDKIGLPGSNVAGTLQMERKATAAYVASGHLVGGTDLATVRGYVDKYIADFRAKALTAKVRDAANQSIQDGLKAFDAELQKLKALRLDVDNRKISAVSAIKGYNEMVTKGVRLFGSLVIIDSLKIYQQGSALVDMGWAREYILREDALITAVQASGGRMNASQHALFAEWSGTHRHNAWESYERLGPELKATMSVVAGSPAYLAFQALEDAILGLRSGPLPASAASWQTTTKTLVDSWADGLQKAGLGVKQQAKPIGDEIIFRLAIAGGLGLLGVIVSVLLSVLLTRSLSRELRGLQEAARELAEQRLPWVVARLRRGENLDVATEAPPLKTGGTTEVARVADAFSRVQHTAIETAVGEAYLRKGISRVFLNLAWRSQSLLHRQLRMLDSLERRAADPETLDDLFQLDHLTTRMRRHAEGLIILSGSAPGRTWSKPVHIVDVLRGALAEVEDYTRVEVATSSPVALSGAAVADVIHLLAELIENGTSYSPPPTEVLVHGEMVGNGFAVEIVDRGVGLAPAEFSELNQRLHRTPEFDLADTDRLGLFVVSRLAARHGIRVTLQPSAYGGVTAVVVIPHELIVSESAISEHPPVADDQLLPAPHLELTQPPLAAVPVPSRVEQTSTGLPRRVKQGNMVPQLRQEAEAAPPEQFTERPPEQNRDLMSSLQSGWQRARDEPEFDQPFVDYRDES